MKGLGDLHKLQQQLIEKYQEKNVSVRLQNSTYLAVTFINSPLNQQESTKREARAAQTAQFVVKNFAAIRELQAIWIIFMSSESRFVFFHSYRSLNAFGFNNRGESLRQTVVTAPAAENENPLSPNVRFSTARNETDISLTRVQLNGDLNHGIALVPYYTAKGDARGPGKVAIAPRFGTFDFASYADRPLFSGDSKLEIICDGQIQYSGSAHLLSPKDSGSEGSTAQFLRTEIPFDQFVKIGAARKATIKLNGKPYDLSPEAIVAFRRLGQLVNPAAED
jgi:hypothetical protein